MPNGTDPTEGRARGAAATTVIHSGPDVVAELREVAVVHEVNRRVREDVNLRALRAESSSEGGKSIPETNGASFAAVR